MLSIYAESPLPCHQTVNYEDPRWLSKWVADKGSGRLCAGALAYYANTCKRPRNPELLHEVDTDPNVFRSPAEFIAFHRPPPPPKRARRRLPLHHATTARSWSDEEDAWGLRAWKAYLALPLTGYAAELLGLRLEELP